MHTRFKVAIFFVLLVLFGLVFLGYTPFRPVGTISIEASFDASQPDYGRWDEVSVVTIEYFAQGEHWTDVFFELEDTLVDAEGWLQYHAQEDAEYFVPAEILVVRGPYMVIYDDGFASGYAEIQFATAPWVDFGTLHTRLSGLSDSVSADFGVETDREWVQEELAQVQYLALEEAEARAQVLAVQQGVNLGNAVSVEVEEDGSLVTARVTFSYYLRLPFLP